MRARVGVAQVCGTGLVCLLFALWAGAAGSTYYVNGASPACSNSGPGTASVPYCSISAALSARAASGVTILVQPATYREQVTVPASGSPSGPLVIRSLGVVMIDGSDGLSSSSLWDRQGSSDTWLAPSVSWSPKQVFVDGARLTASTASPQSMPAHTFRYVSGKGLYANVGGDNPGMHQTLVGRRLHGFRLTGRSWVTIDGFTIARTEDKGIYLTDSSDNVIVQDCAVSQAFRYGISVLDSAAVQLKHNRAWDNADHGLHLGAGTTGAIVEGNEAFHNFRPTSGGNGLRVEASTFNLIQGNVLHENQDSGVDLTSSANDNVFLQNASWGNGDHGFSVLDSTRSLFVGNVAWGNFKHGFAFQGSSTGAKVFDCISGDNGLTSASFDLNVESGAKSGFSSNYNLFWSSGGRPTVRYEPAQYATVAAFAAATGHEARGLQADPRFVDPDQGDFHLAPGSPAIDSASSLVPSWPATDAEGSARKDDPLAPNTGAGPVLFADRGALEYQPPPQPPVAQLLVTPAAGVEPLSVTANASGSSDPDGVITSYLFDFGDGAVTGPQPGPVASHTYDEGQWTATVTVTDDDGRIDSASAGVTVEPRNDPPVAALSLAPLTGPAPLLVTANASGSMDPDGTIVSYRFDFGDGAVVGPQAGATAAHTYGAGAWVASVTVTDNDGGQATAQRSIVVSGAANQSPVAQLAVTPSTGAAPLAVTANASASGDPDGTIVSYLFDFGDGTVVGPQPGPTATHSYATGDWTAMVTVQDNLGATASAAVQISATAEAPPDEIHWTIKGQTSVTFDWRGSAPNDRIRFGTSAGVYTQTVIGSAPSPMPDSSPGPFWEARLMGLQEDTIYYYKIGNGPESTFRTPPPRGASGFWFAQLGDIGSNLRYPGVGPTQAQIAADNPSIPGDDRPRFVLPTGDLAYGDQHGKEAVDNHFNDVMAWSRWAAYMPAWGNHEDDDSPDNRGNYEGRFDFPNSQDSPSSPASGGPGEEWYWFDYGNVRFIAYPEPDAGNWVDWSAKAEVIMDQAEVDPAIAGIVTFGHRPAYSSGSDNGSDEILADHLEALRAGHSKYVLNIGAHSHHYERSHPALTGQILQIVSGGGGATLGGLSSSQPSWSAFRIEHLQHLKVRVTPDRIEGYAVCGPDGAGNSDDCVMGEVIDSWTILFNTPPDGVIDSPAEDVTIPVGGTVTFAGTGTDPDGDLPLTYRWDFEPPGGAAQPVEAVRTAEVGERAQPVGAAIESQSDIGLGTVHAMLTESTLEDPGPLIFTELGTHRVTFTVTDSRGLADPTPATRTVTVTDNLPPTAELVMSPAAGMAPLATTASAAGSVDPDGSIASYRFDFGDGVTVGPQASPTAGHTYAAGTWTASVQVTDDEGGVGTASASVTVSSLMPNLVGNPSFETNTSGWAAYSSSTIARVAGGYQGSWALEVTGPSSTALFGVNDSPNWVASTPAVGTRYRISAWVRSAAGRGQVQLRIREYKGSSQVGPTMLSAPVTLSASWQEVTMDYVTAGSASTLDLQVLDTPAASSERFLMDNVWISIVPPPNQAPNGVIDQPTGPVTLTAGGSVTFAGSGTDPDGNLPLSYQWDFGGGAPARSVEDPGPVTFATPGVYTVALTVRDGLGLADPTPATRTVTVSSLTPNLVGNPSFETNTSGWSSYASSTIARVAGGHDGSWALEVRGPSSTALFGANDSPSWVASTPAVGTRYRISAWVRSVAGHGQVQVRIREYRGTSQVGPTTLSAPLTLSASWQEVTMDYVTAASASSLDLQVLDTPAASSEQFLMDSVSIRIIP